MNIKGVPYYWEIDTKQMEAMNDFKVRCKCGHSLNIANKYGRKICNWCGHWVYATPQDEFRYKLEEANRKKKKMEEMKNENN